MSAILLPPVCKAVEISKGRYAYRSKLARAEGEPNQQAMTARARISAVEEDRAGDVIPPEAFRKHLGNYTLNPVVLLNHASDKLPVGKSETPGGRLTIEINDGKDMWGTCHFSQRLAEAQDVFHLVVEKIIRACSIGFRPITWRRLESSSGSDLGDEGGLYVAEADLLEWSWVCVPCQALAAGPVAVGAEDVEHASWAADRLASYLALGRITHKSLSPALRRSLAPYAATRKAQLAVPGRRTKEDDPDRTEDDPPEGDCQVVLLPADAFPTEEEARAWLRQHSFFDDELQLVVNGPDGPVPAEPGEGDVWLATQFPEDQCQGQREEREMENGAWGVFCDRIPDTEMEGVQQPVDDPAPDSNQAEAKAIAKLRVQLYGLGRRVERLLAHRGRSGR